MLLAAVIQLEALQPGLLLESTGRGVHGLWFRQVGSPDASLADRLHHSDSTKPFTFSPLMGLPRLRDGKVSAASGARAWFRVTALDVELAAWLEQHWLPALPKQVTLPERDGIPWAVRGYTCGPDVHRRAGQADLRSLVQQRLLAPSPPKRWRLLFSTPTAFRGAVGHFPFPLPDLLVQSWLGRWDEWGLVPLPEDLAQRVSERMVVSRYRLRTVAVPEVQGITVGCVGTLTMEARDLSRRECAAVDLLCTYAFWAGTGHRTTQGMGMTRPLIAPRRRSG